MVIPSFNIQEMCDLAQGNWTWTTLVSRVTRHATCTSFNREDTVDIVLFTSFFFMRDRWLASWIMVSIYILRKKKIVILSLVCALPSPVDGDASHKRSFEKCKYLGGLWFCGPLPYPSSIFFGIFIVNFNSKSNSNSNSNPNSMVREFRRK